MDFWLGLGIGACAMRGGGGMGSYVEDGDAAALRHDCGLCVLERMYIFEFKLEIVTKLVKSYGLI